MERSHRNSITSPYSTTNKTTTTAAEQQQQHFTMSNRSNSSSRSSAKGASDNNSSSSTSIALQQQQQQQEQPKILWSCVARDDTILAEAAVQGHPSLALVARTAQELLAKKATPGFEYHTSGSGVGNRLQQRLSTHSMSLKRSTSDNNTDQQQQQPARRFKGIKFHVFEHVSSSDDEDDEDVSEKDYPEWQKPDKDDDDDEGGAQLRVWVFAAVYDPLRATVKEVQSFLEKVVTLTENFREYCDDESWTTAGTLGLQPTFAPILKQRMEEVTYLGNMALLDQTVQACQLQMENNIDLILERGDRIEVLQADATRMQEMASVFRKRAKKVRKKQMMQNAKHGLILGTAITGVVSAIVIPPLVAIL